MNTPETINETTAQPVPEELQTAEDKTVEEISHRLIEKNLTAYKELAK